MYVTILFLLYYIFSFSSNISIDAHFLADSILNTYPLADWWKDMAPPMDFSVRPTNVLFFHIHKTAGTSLWRSGGSSWVVGVGEW